LDGLTSSSNLTFFSELKKPKLGDFRSLNLNVLPSLFSLSEGKLELLVDCKSNPCAEVIRLFPLLKFEYFNDLKGHNNSLKYSNFNKGNNLITSAQGLDLQSTSNSSLPSLNENNEGRTFKFKDLKSPNLGFLSSEKNVRLLDEVSPSKFNASMQQGINNLDDLVSHSIGESILPNSYNIYSSSKNS
jgi:hypothetical protein